MLFGEKALKLTIAIIAVIIAFLSSSFCIQHRIHNTIYLPFVGFTNIFVCLLRRKQIEFIICANYCRLFMFQHTFNFLIYPQLILFPLYIRDGI